MPSEVTYDGKVYTIAREGTAEILDLKREVGPKVDSNQPQTVFYNPIQQYNRDLTVLAIKAFGDGFAAARRARHEKRMENLAQSKRGQKRKRLQAEGTEDAEEPVASRNKSDEGTAPPNEAMNEAGLAAGEERAQHEVPVIEVVGNAHAEGQKQPGGVHEGAKVGDENTTENGVEEELLPRSAQPTFRILDALSATGLRALRYAKEIPMATTITANDVSASATASIKLNAEHNKVSDKINPTTGDANEHMYGAAARVAGGPMSYQVIDLDPYGTAVPFLDAAVRAIVDGGLLCVTCTDSGVFASVGYLEKTYSQYGGLPIKGPHAHEGGLRLILHAIATSAAKYGRAIEPLLSLSIDFYVRVFVRIHRSPVEVKFLANKTMVVYGCDAGCGAWSVQHFARPREKKAKNGDRYYLFSPALAPSANTHCEHCGFKTHQAGPMWGGPLHNHVFIQRILDMLPTLDKSIYGTIPRIEGMLTVALNETVEDRDLSAAEPGPSSEPSITRPIPVTEPVTRAQHPFFFHPPTLSAVLHCVSPSDAAVHGALRGLGYRTTCSHTKAGSICTDAPWSVIWEVMREWVRQLSPIKEGALKKGTAGWAIMKKGRGNAKLIGAKNELLQALENDAITDVAGLKKEVEAALYRLSKLEESSKEREDACIGDDGGAELQSSGAEAEDIKDGTRDLPPSKLKVVFDEKLGKQPWSKRLVRYQFNPRPDWGPMNKASG